MMHYCNLSAQTKISQRDDRGERRTARLCSAVLVCARLSAGPLIAGYRVMMYESIANVTPQLAGPDSATNARHSLLYCLSHVTALFIPWSAIVI